MYYQEEYGNPIIMCILVFMNLYNIIHYSTCIVLFCKATKVIDPLV